MTKSVFVFITILFTQCQKASKENVDARELVKQRIHWIKNYSDSVSFILDESLRNIGDRISDSSRVREIYEQKVSIYFCKVRELNEDVNEVYFSRKISQSDMADYEKEIKSSVAVYFKKTWSILGNPEGIEYE